MNQKPKTYFVGGIIGLFFFLPTAVLAVIFSLQVNSFWDDKNVFMAERYSNWALVCTIVTYVISFFEIILLLLVYSY